MEASEKPSQEAFDSEVTMEEEPEKHDEANEVDEEPVSEPVPQADSNTAEVATAEVAATEAAAENTATQVTMASATESTPIEMSVTSEPVESGNNGENVEQILVQEETNVPSEAPPAAVETPISEPPAAEAAASEVTTTEVAATEVPVATTSEEDLLTSTEASKMEEGDDKFKDIIAESQMDNIFN